MLAMAAAASAYTWQSDFKLRAEDELPDNVFELIVDSSGYDRRVFKAIDKRDGKDVAIKVKLRPLKRLKTLFSFWQVATLNHQEDATGVVKEVAYFRRIDHDNILRFRGAYKQTANKIWCVCLLFHA